MPTFVAVLATALVRARVVGGHRTSDVAAPILARPLAAWALHGGLWLSSLAAIDPVAGTPLVRRRFAVSAFLLMLVLVNNAKFAALREPFVFQDYEYFTDAIRHPRLYIPFLGWWKFFGASAGFISAALVGLWTEGPPC